MKNNNLERIKCQKDKNLKKSLKRTNLLHVSKMEHRLSLVNGPNFMPEPDSSPKRQARTRPKPEHNYKIYFKPESGPIILDLKV